MIALTWRAFSRSLPFCNGGVVNEKSEASRVSDSILAICATNPWRVSRTQQDQAELWPAGIR